MAFESNYVTFIGNLTDDPELRFTGSGTPVCSLRLASNRRWTGKDGQENEETTFMNVVAWRDMGENIAESLRKGDRAIAIGRLKVRSYEDNQGVTKWITEIEADEVAPSLRWARAQVSKGGSGSSGGGSDFSSTPPPPSDDDVPF